MNNTKTPVLIVGGGPIGLALAADLGRRGIEATLIEQSDGSVGSAKMILVSTRTMEFCRQLGIANEVRHWGFPLDYCLDNVFVTGLNGYELGRIKTPSLLKQSDSHHSPERDWPCPQTWFDPILQKVARSFPHINLRFNTKLDDFVQDCNGVTATLHDTVTGKVEIIRALYLIGCDGYSSTVRELLGITMRGEARLDLAMSIYVRIHNLCSYHDKGEAYRYVLVGPEGTWAVLTTIDGRDLWRIQLIGVDEKDFEANKIDIPSLVRKCVGPGVRFAIEDHSLWVRKMMVADRFMDGRVFLAGDAAHAHPPNGGLGMNTGIQDSFDLGWKIAAVFEGWGGSSLLGSYDYERRPASSRAATESLRNYRRLVEHSKYPDVEAPTPTGDAIRCMLGKQLIDANEKSWHPMGVHLGYIYHPSPIVIPDDSLKPNDDPITYEPSTFPGCRAPHVWISETQSILDLFGKSFVLLQFDGVPTDRIENAARLRGFPLNIHRITNPEARELYSKSLVLIRPDGHVCWRGDHAPENSLALIDTVRGAGPLVAGRRNSTCSL